MKRKKTRKKPLYVCYIDLTKAFDYLNRDAFILKLQQRNVDGKFLNTIKSKFLKSSSRVKLNGKISKPIKNRYGVMQGGVLSPKLFNEFLQDIGKYLNPKYGLNPFVTSPGDLRDSGEPFRYEPRRSPGLIA